MNGNVKLGRVAARSGEWAQHFSNASCYVEALCTCTMFQNRVDTLGVLAVLVTLTTRTHSDDFWPEC